MKKMSLADTYPINKIFLEDPTIQLQQNNARIEYNASPTIQYMINVICIYTVPPMNEKDSGVRCKSVYFSTPSTYRKITDEEYHAAIEKAFDLTSQIDLLSLEKYKTFEQKEAVILCQLLMTLGINSFHKKGEDEITISPQASLLLNHMLQQSKHPVLHIILRNLDKELDSSQWQFFGCQWDSETTR